MGRIAASAPEPSLNFYGLGRLGYDSAIPLTGNYIADQLAIEFICFRISHRRSEGGLDKFGHFRKGVDLLFNNPSIPSMKSHIWNPWGEKMLRKACECEDLGVAGPTSAGKSDPFALWAVFNYIADPTHVKCLLMSSTIDGAKLRIWKSFREYIEALPNMPGRALWSTNRILGPNYEGTGTGESSGVMLLASEKSREKDALEKMIGIKAPMSGSPDDSFEALKAHPEFQDLSDRFDDDYLRDLLPRLANLTSDRKGKLILIVDEATGLAESLLTAINSNMKPGNAGALQTIFIGNPNLHWDPHGIFCEPAIGWDKVTLEDEEWETVTGGTCIRFNGERNPRLTEKNEKYSWMLTEQRIKDIERDFGRGSLHYYRMVLGFWAPEGADSGVYSQAEIEANGSMKKSTWGFQPPIRLSSLDPSFSNHGDRAACVFWKLGIDVEGKRVLEVDEIITIKADINNITVPISYQLVRNWRRECEKRGVPPENACFDSTGGGITFGDVVRTQWSAAVQGISSGGKAPRRPVGSEKGLDGEPVLCCDRFANMATALWYGAHPFLRSGQIRGLTPSLAKEICSRQHEKNSQGSGRVLKIESKRVYKSREGNSPDDSDGFFLGIEHAKTRHGFKPSEKAAVSDSPGNLGKVSTWKAFCDKARRITTRRNLR